MVLVPEGVYSAEMIENLMANGWHYDQYVLIPLVILFDYELDEKKNIKEIIKNRDNHFIIYGTD